MLGKSLIFVLLLTPSVSAMAQESSDDNPYKSIAETMTITPPDAKADDCAVRATIDFAKYAERLPIFREAFMNRDYSIDFYGQRRKQVLVFTVLKHAAEMMTESLYQNRNQPECRFSVTISYADKYGQDRTFEALTWRFNAETAAKVNWQKFNPRNFADIALDYKISDQATKWVSDEPSFAARPQSVPDAADVCDPFMFNANAIFIRATTYCKKDFMDSPEGLEALEGAKKCRMPEAQMKEKAMAAMQSLDTIARQQGRSAVCPFVEAIAREVRQKTH